MAENIPRDARLLTYAELGELLGIEPESAKRRAVRQGWRRVPGWQDTEALRAALLTSERQRAEAEGRAAALSERIEAEKRDADGRNQELIEAQERTG